MIQKTAILFMLIFLSGSLSAQDEPESRDMVFLEALGIGGLWSINYERLVYFKGRFNIGTRLGIGINRFKDYRDQFNPDFVVPIAACFTYGNNWKGEISLGTAYASSVVVGLELQPERTIGIHGNAGVGIRYQKAGPGPTFRAGYSPLITTNAGFKHWGYASIGWTF